MKRNVSPVEDVYTELANAIVFQAVKDYREALKILIKKPSSMAARLTVAEVEVFFRSTWFSFLTTIDPEMLIRELRAEVA